MVRIVRDRRPNGRPKKTEDDVVGRNGKLVLQPWEADYRLRVRIIFNYEIPSDFSDLEAKIILMSAYGYGDLDILTATGIEPDEYYDLIYRDPLKSHILVARKERELQLLDQAGFSLKEGFLEAIAYNRRVLTDETSLTKDRLAASKTIADLTMKTFELQQRMKQENFEVRNEVDVTEAEVMEELKAMGYDELIDKYSGNPKSLPSG